MAREIYEGQQPIPFDPLRENVLIPQISPTLTDSQMREWQFIKRFWQTGKQRFRERFIDTTYGQGLRDYPWDHPSEDIPLRYIFEQVIGYKDSAGRQKGGYKTLGDVRRILDLGNPPRTERTSTGVETIYVFTPLELSQLIIGFFAYQESRSK